MVLGLKQIADEMKPHPIVINILAKLSTIIPTWKIIPTNDIINSAIKNPEWRQEIRNNPYCYKGRPRLKTGSELLMASLDIEKNLDKVSLPFIIVHGGDDIVTDPSISRALYESSVSQDKTFKLYPGMWHALTSGEPEENIDLVFSDIADWLDKRSMSSSFRSEIERKSGHDPKTLASYDAKAPCLTTPN
ncbi:Caffeoylshikimate esterase [Ananas comosus]|uniref:Caffeoylshikimate esterase n=1 Tax=Ananas comosus TaxID=4615 RepID=A0A199VVK0_ANACO|nr:Caffeoylshikimate esterase [Ananas comosus]